MNKTSLSKICIYFIRIPKINRDLNFCIKKHLNNKSKKNNQEHKFIIELCLIKERIVKWKKRKTSAMGQ